jgi:hypothetical protein
MGRIVRFEGDDGVFMLLEVRDDSDVQLIADERGVTTAVTRLEDSLQSLRGPARALRAAVEGFDWEPEEVTLELGVELGVEGGVIVAKGSAKATASVTLTWRGNRTPG